MYVKYDLRTFPRCFYIRKPAATDCETSQNSRQQSPLMFIILYISLSRDIEWHRDSGYNAGAAWIRWNRGIRAGKFTGRGIHPSSVIAQ